LAERGWRLFLPLRLSVLPCLSPWFFFGSQIINEARQLYIFGMSKGGIDSMARGAEIFINNNLHKISPSLNVPKNFSYEISAYIRSWFVWLLHNINSVVSSFTYILINVTLLLFALYYLFQEGHKLKESFVKLSPQNPKPRSVCLH